MKKAVAVALFFFCMIVFSDALSVFAHEMYTKTAEEASDANMGSDDQEAEKTMKDFLLHVKEHRTKLATVDRQIEFRNALRTDNGVWRRGDTYIIMVNTSGDDASAGDIISFHAKYPAAVSGSLRGVEIFRNLIDSADAEDGKAVCDQDDTREYGNHICAVEDSQGFFIIAGFNHKRSEEDHSDVISECPEFDASELQTRGWLSADMVDDEESLVRYLKGVVEHVSEELGQSGGGTQGGIAPAGMIQLMPCWREWPWKSGSIYFYIVTNTDKMFGIFNGNTAQLQDRTLRLVDDNGVAVAERILEEVRKSDATPNEGFLTYLWDDPTVRGDEVVCDETGRTPGPAAEDEEVFCEAGNPIPGRSTGTSLKYGYFILTDFGLGGRSYVVGSGIYPESGGGSGSGGGGCSVVPGNHGNMGAGVFNLFLITAALFLALFRIKRQG